MLWSRKNASIDKTTRNKLGTCLSSGTFEGQMRKKSESCIGRYGDIVIVCRRVMDRREDDIVGMRYVLVDQAILVYGRRRLREWDRALTLPLLFSTHMVFFLWSTQSGPARVGIMVDGGTWRRPGPSLRVAEELGDTGSTSGGISSPGRTNADIAW